jgi:hypothetical protein
VGFVAVGLDNQPSLGPEEVDRVGPELLLAERPRQAVAAAERAQAPLELAAGRPRTVAERPEGELAVEGATAGPFVVIAAHVWMSTAPGPQASTAASQRPSTLSSAGGTTE